MVLITLRKTWEELFENMILSSPNEKIRFVLKLLRLVSFTMVSNGWTRTGLLTSFYFKMRCRISNCVRTSLHNGAYENGLVYQWTVRKDNELDLATLLSWAEEEAAMASKGCDDDICVTSVLDKGKGLADKGKWLVDKGKGIMVDEVKAGRKTARSKNSGIVIEENVNPTFSEDDDFYSDMCMEQRFKGSAELEEMYKGNTDSESEYSDKSVDYLSEGEDELISLRKRNNEAKKKPNQSNINSSTIVAGCSRPNRVYDVGESYTVIDHVEYMDKLMHQLRDKGDCFPDPFTILENDQSNEKSLIHDEQTYWKVRKPKYVDAAQLKEYLTYYSLANRFSLWFYRSSKETLIARRGMRPEKLKDIEKGKQMKHIKYHSDGRNKGSNCPFRCYGKMMVTESSFQVISLNEEHTCVRNFKSYGKEILDSNDGSTVKLGVNVNPDGKTYFDRFYCCFYGLKKGFQLGCRHVIALDGCFLKKPNVSEILTAVGRDGNNLIYPIAWAVVNVENKDNWSWIGNNCEAIANGFSECFNSVLLLVRNKPLITMLESMRVIVIERLNTMRQIFEKWTGDIFLNIQKTLELNKDKHRFWHVIPAGGNLFEVRNVSEAFTVGEHKRTCTRRMWERGGKTMWLGVRTVTSEGTPAARIGKGGQTLKVRRGTSGSTSIVRRRGGQTLGVRYGRLGRWFGLGDETQKEPNDQPTTLTQQSQVGIQQQTSQTAKKGRQA
nr:pentatricopeptide repeat-containing protein [Tanacetum cinerariifolium]